MGLTDAKTWDEAAVFVIAELGSLKKRILQLESCALVAAACADRISDDVEETNKHLDTFRQAVDYEGIEARLADLEASAEGPNNRLSALEDAMRDMRRALDETTRRHSASPSAPTQPTETSQYSPFCAKRTTEKLVELHEADLVNKTLEARVLELEAALAEWQGGFHKRGDHLRAAEAKVTELEAKLKVAGNAAPLKALATAEAKVTELEVDRNLAKARISAITDKLRSLVTQLRVQNTTAPHWRSDTAVGAYRHSANLLETALIELALVEPAPVADSAHAAKEHAEGLARMLEAGTAAQIGTYGDR